MLVSEIGEFELIRLLTAELGVDYPPSNGAIRRPGMLVDLGDDAVVTDRRDGALIWTTDTMVAGVHFLPEQTSWECVGWKALAVNLSDIAAMGGRPHLALITLTLPGDFYVEDALELYRGLHAAARRFGATVGGGDVVRATTFSVTVALSGWALTSNLHAPMVMTRGAARIGDVVAVTGTVGDSAGGLQLLLDADEEPSIAKAALREAHERPQPRVESGMAAVRAGIRCAIDVSDGLVQDLGHVMRASGTGIRLEAARIPTSEALREVFPARALGFGLSGGEDYELVLVGQAAAMERLMATSPVAITEIGEVVHYEEPRVAVVDESGREIPLKRGGWDHFGAV